MGCGASAARVPSVAALDPGNTTQNNAVVPQDGVAKPAQSCPGAQKAAGISSASGQEKDPCCDLLLEKSAGELQVAPNPVLEQSEPLDPEPFQTQSVQPYPEAQDPDFTTAQNPTTSNPEQREERPKSDADSPDISGPTNQLAVPGASAAKAATEPALPNFTTITTTTKAATNIDNDSDNDQAPGLDRLSSSQSLQKACSKETDINQSVRDSPFDDSNQLQREAPDEQPASEDTMWAPKPRDKASTAATCKGSSTSTSTSNTNTRGSESGPSKPSSKSSKLPGESPKTLVEPRAASSTAPIIASKVKPLQPLWSPSEQQQQQQQRMVNCAVSLQFLIEFCNTVPEDMPTWKVVTEVIVPATRERQCRYVETIHPRHVGPCAYFISHRWATPFSHLVRYVRKHLVELGDVVEDGDGVGSSDGCGAGGDAAGAPAGLVLSKARQQPRGRGKTAANDDEEAEPKRSADKVFVWCDIFAINQHPGQVQADDLAQLKDCVEACHQTLLCLDDKGLVLTRIWCLYEIWNTILAGGPPRLAVLGYDVNQDAFKEVYITLDVAEAQATVDSDRVRILADIAASTGLQELNLVIKSALVESTQAEAENALKVLLPKAKEWKEYERVITAVSKHMQMLSALGRHQEAQRYGYILQTVNTSWQKNQTSKSATPGAYRTSSSSSTPPKAAAGSGGGGGGGSGSGGGGGATSNSSTAAVEAATAADGGDEAELPEWHWSRFPRDPTLRQLVEKGTSAERQGRFDTAMSTIRDAVSKAQQQVNATHGSTLAALNLDLAGCHLHLASCLAARGFLDQAVSEAGEPAVQAFEKYSGPHSLVFASAAHQVALLAKNDWPKKDLRARLLEAAYGIRERHLGPTHEATLESLREKAEMVFMSGDSAAGVELFHRLSVRMSDGMDLAAKPPESGAAAAAASIQELSTKACETWFLLATYLNTIPGHSEEVIRICRALIPHKRREHIRRLRDVAADPTSEYAKEAVSDLHRLGLSRAVASSRPASVALSASSSAAAAPGERGSSCISGGASTATAVDLEPDGLADPDDPRVDVVGNISEINLWSTVLAKEGKLRDAVLLQWRLAEACRGNKSMATMETQLPTGKVTMVDAYECCLMLDLSIPGAAKVAAKMLQERDGISITTTTINDNNGNASKSGSAAGAKPTAASVPKPVYDGPSYLELVQEMSTKWAAMDFKAAEPLCRQIIECQTAVHGPVSKEVVDAKDQLARLLMSAGRNQDAIEEMRAALALHEQILHGKDPTMSRTLQGLAGMVAESDRGEAEKLHRRTVDLLTKVYGPDHFEVGAAMMQLAGFVMSDYERVAEGQDIMQRGLAIHQKFQEQQAAMSKAF